jgi:hypothetical protein
MSLSVGGVEAQIRLRMMPTFPRYHSVRRFFPNTAGTLGYPNDFFKPGPASRHGEPGGPSAPRTAKRREAKVCSQVIKPCDQKTAFNRLREFWMPRRGQLELPLPPPHGGRR